MPARPYDAHMWRRLRPGIAERDGWVCQLCKKPVTPNAYDIDHVMPWQEGGSWYDPANLRTTCRPCNRGRGPKRQAMKAEVDGRPKPTPSRQW